MAVPEVIAELVKTFDRNIVDYESSRYKEEQVRHDFINDFFGALGWDMNNKQGASEAYKEVLYESSLKVGGTTKAPDYAFRIGGIGKFFVEAKKPSVNLENDPDPAYQLRSYAWNAKLPISVLTDFDEFAVYDCRYPPKKTDRADTARVLYLTYDEYLTRWDEIAGIFSKTAIIQGSFDKFAEATKTRTYTKEVDAVFLEDITLWRENLARNMALRNIDLSVEALNASVQATIDRIIFLRICEDRGIEKYGRIQEIAGTENIYAGLCDLFKHADDRYNSGLFNFENVPGREFPDLLALNLKIDDKILADITSSLYPPSPYNFAIISPEILGQVYEQFLGKVIRLTDGRHAKVEDKPEVKKAGGVKYTPVYIVQYIVRTTLEPLLKGKTPQEVSFIYVLDPACGSGSFLLGAYQYLLDWHLDWYIKNLAPVLDKGISITTSTVKNLLPIAPEDNDKSQRIKAGKRAKSIKAKAEARAAAASIPIYKAPDGDWHLTIAERKRIILNNIFGVDIDRQAVEVTKLSLLLKVLEGENQQTVADLLKYSRERVLPDLDKNIKSGNSLIGTDVLQTDGWLKIGKTEHTRINPFDWETEFPEIMRGGGFHAIIGNPPYIRTQTMKEWASFEVEYYKQKYASAGKGNYDIYVVFVERSLSLLNESGRLGFILPHKFFNAKYGQPLRSIIASGKHLSEIVHFGDKQVFEGATTYTCLLFLNKMKTNSFEFIKVDDIDAWKNTENVINGQILAEGITSQEWNFAIGNDAQIFDKLAKMPVKLGQIAKIFVGLQTSADTVFLFKNSKIAEGALTDVESKAIKGSAKIDTSLLKHVIRSGEIGRYWANPSALVLFPYKRNNDKFGLIPEEEMIKCYPSSWAYLKANYGLLSEREHGKFSGKHWYQLYPKNLDTWEQPKIMLPYMVTRLSAFYDESGYYFVNVTTGGFGLTVDESQGKTKYIVGLINSKLLDWFLRHVSTTFHGGYFAANKQFLVQLPIRTIDFSNPEDTAIHDHMINLVDSMQSLNKQVQKASTPHEKIALQRQIDATDKQIDRLVYELYSLTDDEIKVVEGT